MYSEDVNAALEAIGANLRVPDARQLQDAVIAHINNTGGIAGHPVEAAYHNVRATDNSQTMSQAACTQWTQDDHVFAVVAGASVQDNDVMRRCLGNAGVPAIYSNFYSTTSEAEFRRSPLWFEPQTLSLEQFARVYASGLDRQGYFDGARIGLVHSDTPSFREVVDRVLLPALEAAGAEVVATAAENIRSAEDLGPGNAQMSNAVLRFRTANVTSVMFFSVWTASWALFAQNAESQRWRPQYGVSSQNAPEIMIQTGLIPNEQLPGTLVVGWNPGVDLRPEDWGMWPRQELCRTILREAGMDESEGLSACGSLLLLQDAGRLAESPLTRESLTRGLEALGDNLQLAVMPTARFGPDRHFGAAAWRPAAYDRGCTCYHYTGSPSAI